MGFEGKVAIVTGAGRGIGKATAITLAKRGAKVCAASRTAEDLEITCQTIKELGGESIYVPTDITQLDQIKNMIDKTVGAFGRIDILVNNAAGMSTTAGGAGILDITDEAWNGTLTGTVTSVYRCSHYALPHMIKAGSGTIVNVASTRGLSGRRGNSAYGAGKAAIVNLTRCMALDLLDYRIRVNCVCPGHVDNEFFLAAKAIIAEPEREQEILASQPLSIQKRIAERLATLRDNPIARPSLGRGFNGTPQELANAIVFLASDEASFINGEILTVDGGSSAGK